jgi:hypothetical protein
LVVLLSAWSRCSANSSIAAHVEGFDSFFSQAMRVAVGTRLHLETVDPVRVPVGSLGGYAVAVVIEDGNVCMRAVWGSVGGSRGEQVDDR